MLRVLARIAAAIAKRPLPARDGARRMIGELRGEWRIAV